MPFDNILTGAPRMRATLQAAHAVARTDANILLTGESGTGKEVMAQAIHKASRRHRSAFITVNCAALPETLAESLLFGHRKGAFTGADNMQAGLIPAADGGTLFLDEVGELPLGLQAKLLRFLESGEILPLGETRARQVNVRVIAATHRQLLQQVATGHFRHDLYYRLNVMPVELPALRERREDISLLSQHFLAHFARHHQLEPATFSAPSLRMLEKHPWLGNVRELKNTCERLSILLPGQHILPSNLPLELQRPARLAAVSHIHLPSNGLSLEALERDLLQQALQQSSQNKTQAAGLLGITRDAFNYRLKKHALA